MSGFTSQRNWLHELLYRRRRSGSLSAAGLLLATYGPYGIVTDFVDQSIAIASSDGLLNFTSKGRVSNGALIGPGAKLTYIAPSPKLSLQSDGTYKYQAHNLYLNSAAPANQSVTVRSGESYTIILTGSVSIALSGATTGTVTAGSTVFTAASGTLTCGSTTGTGTVHLRLTNSLPDYIATGAAPVYDLPYRFNTLGVCQGILIEPQPATNLFLNNTTGTTQSFTVTAQAYTLSFYGTGTITLSGASTAGPLAGTGANNRVTLTFTPSAGTLTCTVSGSVTDVQLETGSTATSVIRTFGSAVVRAADQIYLGSSLIPSTAAEVALYANAALTNAGTFNNVALALNNSGSYSAGPGFLLRFGSNALASVGGNFSVINSTISPALTDGQFAKIAGTAKVSGTLMTVTNRGLAATTASTGDWAGTHNRIQIGALTSGGAQPFNGIIAQLAIFPKYDTALIQSITT